MPESVSVLYATVSGNAETLAEETATRLGAEGYQANCQNLANFPARRLEEVGIAVIFASTWGEGLPPPDAADFCEGVAMETSGLEHLRFAVFALGSSSYRDFCGCGRQIDEALANRGARRLLARVEADLKFRRTFATWLPALLRALRPAS